MTTKILKTLASAIAAMGLLVGSAAALEVASSVTVGGQSGCGLEEDRRLLRH